MFTLAAILAFAGLGSLLVRYGTIAKNRWGINLASVSCPNCNSPLTGVQKTRSLRHTIWGGYTCPVCGEEVDKWGQVVTRDKFQDDSKNFWTKQRNIRFNRLSDAPVSFWVFGAILLALDLWWDLRHPRGFVLDVVFLILLFVFYGKYWKQRNHTNS